MDGCAMHDFEAGIAEAKSGPKGIAHLDQSPVESGSLRVFSW
jgi:hypothetical protein